MATTTPALSADKIDLLLTLMQRSTVNVRMMKGVDPTLFHSTRTALLTLANEIATCQ